MKTQLLRRCTEEAESIEQMIRRLSANKEAIPQNVPPIYTPKKDGVIPDHDIRADRFDAAYEACDKMAASDIAKGAEKGIEIDVEQIKSE